MRYDKILFVIMFGYYNLTFYRIKIFFFIESAIQALYFTPPYGVKSVKRLAPVSGIAIYCSGLLLQVKRQDRLVKVAKWIVEVGTKRACLFLLILVRP